MQKQQLEDLKAWFDEYVKSFYGNDSAINANLRLKQEHSQLVGTEMRYLTDKLALEPSDALIAQAIALLHDVGRFPQFAKYHTYNDQRSVSHSGLGLKVLRDQSVLEDVETNEKQIIEKAIAWHGKKQLPDDLPARELLFCRLIRDADKLDIFRVVTTYHFKYQQDPANFEIEIEFPDTPGYSPEIVEGVLKGQRIDYKMLQSLNDMKLLQVAWVYDINFTASLERIIDKGYLDLMFSFLPDDKQTGKIRTKIIEYVNSRIDQAKSKAG